MSNESNRRHWPMAERYGYRLKCFLKRYVLSWCLNALSTTESEFDVVSCSRRWQRNDRRLDVQELYDCSCLGAKDDLQILWMRY